MRLFHYTVSEYAQKILASGVIRLERFPAEVKKYRSGKPAAWFSSNAVMEKSALKAVKEGDVVRPLTLDEQAEKFGIVRFAFENPTHGIVFVTWANYKKYSGIGADVAQAMEKGGIERGASPADWFASHQPVSLKQAIGIDVWNEGKWTPIRDMPRK